MSLLGWITGSDAKEARERQQREDARRERERQEARRQTERKKQEKADEIRQFHQRALDEETVTLDKIRAAREMINVLVIGLPGVGKSTFVSSMQSCITHKYQQEVAPSGKFANFAAGSFTMRLRRYPLQAAEQGKSPIFIYDMPGLVNQAEERIKAILECVLLGKVPCQEEILLSAGQTARYVEERFQISDPAMKIDRIVFVHSCNEDIPENLAVLVKKLAQKHEIITFSVLSHIDKKEDISESKKELDLALGTAGSPRGFAVELYHQDLRGYKDLWHTNYYLQILWQHLLNDNYLKHSKNVSRLLEKDLLQQNRTDWEAKAKEEEKNATKYIESNRQQINVLMVGPHRSGKSTLVSSLETCITKDNAVDGSASRPMSFDRLSFRLRSYNLFEDRYNACITMYDLPGFPDAGDEHIKAIMRCILLGKIPINKLISVHQSMTQDMVETEYPMSDPANMIDRIIFVQSCKQELSAKLADVIYDLSEELDIARFAVLTHTDEDKLVSLNDLGEAVGTHGTRQFEIELHHHIHRSQQKFNDFWKMNSQLFLLWQQLLNKHIPRHSKADQAVGGLYQQMNITE